MTDKHTNLDFSEALFLLKQGYRVRRVGLLGDIVKMELTGNPTLIRDAGYGQFEAWQPGQGELFATDWYVVLNEAA